MAPGRYGEALELRRRGERYGGQVCKAAGQPALLAVLFPADKTLLLNPGNGPGNAIVAGGRHYERRVASGRPWSPVPCPPTLSGPGGRVIWSRPPRAATTPRGRRWWSSSAG